MAELYKNKLSESEKAWLAGFIDGEGYLGITFQKKKETRWQAASPLYHPYLIIANSNKSALSYIQDIVGDGKVYLNKKSTPKTKESFQYRITKLETLQSILESLEPYFKIKSSQCRVLIKFVQRRRATILITGRGSRGHTSFTARDHNSYITLLGLNKRGPMHYVASSR